MTQTKKLWQTADMQLHPLVEAYTVGEDYLLDQELLPYDIQASIAHAKMLREMKVLSEEEYETAKRGLEEIHALWEKGAFPIRREDEDGHMAIERYLTEHYGEIGKKIHTGRSRNDQALVMLRLFMKEKLQEIRNLGRKLETAFRQLEKKHANVNMPGYTHAQKAMPTTVGSFFEAYADGIDDALILFRSARAIIDQNPLGSASGFGIRNFAHHREITTQELGFKKTQANPIYCGMSRGYFEHLTLGTLSGLMVLLGKLSNDMLLFTTSDLGFFSLPNSFTTGSSIMPQKRNYDLFEILRGNTKLFFGYQQQIQQIITSVYGIGYQRDLQLTKKPFLLAVLLCKDTIQLLSAALPEIAVHEDKLQAAMTDDLYVTEQVYDLVNKGVSFREAYVQVKEKLNKKS